MKFQPYSEQELQLLGLVKPGTYDFEIVEAKNRRSRSGNDMIEVKIKFWDMDGRERIVFDYLLEAMAFKLRHFCEVTGLLDKYEEGSLEAQDCIGRCGKLELIIQPGNAKPEGGYYPDKNSVKDYIREDKYAKPSTRENDEFISDPIPF